MSWQASAWAKNQKTGSPAKKAVLLCLAEATDQWGFTWAGEVLIADEAELSERHVRRIVSGLAELDLITIFKGRGTRGARRNLYRLNFRVRPKDEIPDDHPSLSGRYQHHAGLESLAEAVDKISGKRPDKMSDGPPDKSSEATRQIERSHRTPESGEPIGTSKNRETRARDADRPDGSASPDALSGNCKDGTSTPINAHWNARQADLANAFEPDALHWLQDCIPHEDDGETLVLAVPSRWFGEQIDARIGRPRLERTVDRTITFLPTEYAHARRQERISKQNSET